VELKLNSNAVVFYTAPEDEEVIEDSITMLDAITPYDNLDEGVCCASVKPIKAPRYFTTPEGPKKKFACFDIINQGDVWTLCEEPHVINEFKTEIIIKTIAYYRKQHHLPPANMVVQRPKSLSFSWTQQEKWFGECMDGKFQSPIKID